MKTLCCWWVLDILKEFSSKNAMLHIVSLIKVLKFSLQTVLNFSSLPQSPHNAASLFSRLNLNVRVNSVLHWNMSVQNILMRLVAGRVLNYFLFSECTEDEPEDCLWLPERRLKTFSGFSIWKYENLNSPPPSLELPSLFAILELFSWRQTKWIVTAIWARGGSSSDTRPFIKYPGWCDKPVKYVTSPGSRESLKICSGKCENSPEVARWRCDEADHNKDDAATTIYIHNITSAASW